MKPTPIKISKEEMEQAMLVTDKKILKKWAESRLRKNRLKAAKNPNTPIASLKRLQSYLENDEQIIKAAKNNPRMFKDDVDEIWAKAKSKVAKTRKKVISNPFVTVDIINYLLHDKDIEVAKLAARHKIIDRSSFDELKKANDIDTDVYRAFFKNKNFKKEWLYEWIELNKKLGIITLDYIYDHRFYSNDDEWIQLFDFLAMNQPSHITPSIIGSFWLDFFAFPRYNYSEKMILAVLEKHGSLLLKYSPDTLYRIVDKNNATDNVKGELLELKWDDKFLPDIIKELLFIYD